MLTSGSIVYTGPVSEIAGYLQSHGFPCLEEATAADYFIDIARATSNSSGTTALINAWMERRLPSLITQNEMPDAYETNGAVPGQSITFHLRQLRALISRNLWVSLRDRLGMAGFIFEALVIGVLVGWIFYRIPPTLTGIRSMEGFIYTVIGLRGFLVRIFATYKVCFDMQVSSKLSGSDIRYTIEKERGNGIRPWRFSSPTASLIFLRKVVPLPRQLISDIFVPLLFSAVTYSMSGYRPGFSHFMVFAVVNILHHLANVTLVMLCVVVGRDFTQATVLINVISGLMNLSCGFFIQAQSFPIYLRWIKYIGFMYWAFAALCSEGSPCFTYRLLTKNFLTLNLRVLRNLIRPHVPCTMVTL